MTAREVQALTAARSGLVVDHGLCVPGADVVFVHNLLSEARRFVQRDDWLEDARRESEFFERLGATTPIVANSGLVKAALIEHFRLDGARIIIHYPGFRSAIFTAHATARFRRAARSALGIGEGTPLIGFITSGDFQARGLDLFLASAEHIARARPEARFLVVGSKRLPDWAKTHPLLTAGKVAYRPKSGRPERWFAALDVFLYAARFEAFGMVISEAQAMGIPVLTSRRVGAAECLPQEYEDWLLDHPDVDELAARAIALLDDDTARRRLAVAGARSVAAYDQGRYLEATLATILAQNR
jgi:glycosyltransferase involved in cell wall biosynthesis